MCGCFALTTVIFTANVKLPSHHNGLAPNAVQNMASGRLVLGAILLHCHLSVGQKGSSGNPWPAAAHMWAFCMYSIGCAAGSTLQASCPFNANLRAHVCVCIHGFIRASAEHSHCCRFAVSHGLGSMLWDQASWRISPSVVPVWAIACTWPVVGALHFTRLSAPPM